MKNDISKLKSKVNHLEQNMEGVSHDTFESGDRGSALNALEKIKKIAQKKMNEGFTQRRIPLEKGGYKEIWIKA